MTRNELINWEPFKPFSVGFDNLFDDFDRIYKYNSSSINHYPPYNIRKVNDTDYVIELAVAGFGKKDIEVKSVENTLTIKSDCSSKLRTFSFFFSLLIFIFLLA